jgi:hypothetical protein
MVNIRMLGSDERKQAQRFNSMRASAGAIILIQG